MRPRGLGTLLVVLALQARRSDGEPVTFTKDLAPVVFRRCAGCHRPGGTGPFSLLTSQDLGKHARQIVAVTKSGFMPPWLPEPGPLHFVDEARLTPAEVGLFERWVEGGRIKGKAADLPPVPDFRAGWELGEPDLILKAPRAFTLQAEGGDVYRNFVFRPPSGGPRYVRALEIRPGVASVHHANLLLDRTRSVRHLDGADGQPGFSGMDVGIPASVADPESHFLFWKPGSRVAPEPAGMAWTLDGHGDLVLNMHLKPSGKPEAVQPSIGLYFTDEAPRILPVLVQLENDRALDIPPGAANFVVSSEFVLPVDCDLTGIYPHAHYLGKEVTATAILPGGREQTLLRIRRWDVTWQGVYRYSDPVFLPRGTRILMRWAFDNSAANPANPSHPPKRVRAGDQTTDEMAHLWLQLVPRGAGDQRAVIQEAVARRKLHREPDDFTAHFNLGGILRARGDGDGAIGELQAALRIRPGDARALNALGAILQVQGRRDEAETQFRRAAENNPDDPDAHYNLAGLLLARGVWDEAIAQLRQVLRVATDDPEAREKLAGALESRAGAQAAAGDLRQAVADLREVAAFRPEDSDAWANLGVALARQGDFAEAGAALERALRLNPNSEGARRNLDRVRQRVR